MRFEASAATDTGLVRKLNEDAFACLPDQGLFVVCDGMGGAASGEVASQLAAESIVDFYTTRAPESGNGEYRPATQRLHDALVHANTVVHERAHRDPDHAGMGTTVVAVAIDDDVASIAHVGDSRAYLYQAGRFEALTRDHSLVEEEVQAGVLDRESSLHAAHQNVLLRAVGAEPVAEVDVAEVPLQAGDYVLLCSDGLTRTVSETEMQSTIAALGDPQRICERLIADANANGGPDNVTVVVVGVSKGWWLVGWVWLGGSVGSVWLVGSVEITRIKSA
jgi:protein phosphatase